MIKRLMDILLSFIAIVILGVPMLIIALAVRLTSRGPAIFRQRRAGRNGTPFTILKFRTMRSDADPYGGSPQSAGDSRLTPIGAFLRETSLDELPQLFNILLGQMSLVGPRPLYERQAAVWNERQRRRIEVRPGLSGYAQAYGRGGMTHEEKIELDVHYVENRSFLLDGRIIFRTMTNLFRRRTDVYEQRYSRLHEREGDAGRAVVFDMDDTLYAERDYVRSGYGAVGEHLRAALERTEPFEQWLWERFLAGQTEGAFNALSEQFDLALTDEQIAEAVAVYRTHRPDIAPRPGVVELLTALRDSCRLGLLSDGFLPAQQYKLEALGIGELFDAVVFTEELGRDCWKPSPAGFDAIRDKLAVPDTACTYIADNPAKDFVAPNALNWTTIQLRLPNQIHTTNPAPPDGEAQTVVSSLEELQTALT